MIQKSLLQKLKAISAKYEAVRNTAALVLHPQPFVVRLQPIVSVADQVARWDAPQRWCRENVAHSAGGLWSCRMDRQNDTPVFTFSDEHTAVWFRLLF